MEARGELIFWQQLHRLRFESDIWPLLKGLSIRMATDASDFAWGGHTMTGPLEIAREYFSEWEAIQTSTYRELRNSWESPAACKRWLTSVRGDLHVGAANPLGIVNQGCPKLIFNELARELFWFCLRHRITTVVVE